PARTRVSTKPECRCRHRRSEFSNQELPGSKGARGRDSAKGAAAGRAKSSAGNGADLPATTQGVSEEERGSAGELLHRKGCSRWQRLQTRDYFSRRGAPVRSGAILQSCYSPHYSSSLLFA